MLGKFHDIGIAVEGLIFPEQSQKMNIIKKYYDTLKICKENLNALTLVLVDLFNKELVLVSTVPAFTNPFPSIGMISEIGIDMSVFPAAKHLCSWAVLTPQNNESTGNKNSFRISRSYHF